jgi:hypothetical protein
VSSWLQTKYDADLSAAQQARDYLGKAEERGDKLERMFEESGEQRDEARQDVEAGAYTRSLSSTT